MSRKVKKGSKKASKKNAEQEVKEELTEVDKELFQIQITDLMRKVERLKNRCRELETSNEEYQKRYDQLDEDRADIIAYLKRVLQQKTDEITELEERLVGLQKSKEADTIMYMERINQFDKDYKLMHEQLTSEIKLLSGKLNSLEEFRIQREDLTKKYKNQEERMAEQETLHQQAMYDVEKKFIIGKDKLKKEMEAKLLQLATDFREATQLRIAATTHRAIRENIALSNEYNQMLEESRVLIDENANLKKLNRQLQLESRLHEEEKNTVIANNKVQLKMLESVAEDHKKVVGEVLELQQELQRCSGAEEELAKLRVTVETQAAALQEFNNLLDATKAQDICANTELAMSRLREKRLQIIIEETIFAIKDALLIHEDPSRDEAEVVASRENLLETLLQMLSSAELRQQLVTEALPTFKDVKPEYRTGDLSLVSCPNNPQMSQDHVCDQSCGSTDVQPVTPTETPTVTFFDEVVHLS